MTPRQALFPQTGTRVANGSQRRLYQTGPNLIYSYIAEHSPCRVCSDFGCYYQLHTADTFWCTSFWSLCELRGL